MPQLDLLQLFCFKINSDGVEKSFQRNQVTLELWHLTRETAYLSSRYCYFSFFFRFGWIVGLLIASAKISDREGNISSYSFYGQMLNC